MAGAFYCPISFNIRVYDLIEVLFVPADLLQISITAVTRKSDRKDKSCMAEEIILHARLISDLHLSSVKNPADQRFIGGAVFPLTDGDLFHGKRYDPVFLAASRSHVESKHDVFSGKFLHELSGREVIPNEDNVLGSIRVQRFQCAVELRVAHDHKDDVKFIVRS